jgi:protein-S-isoprenylcysteine O-methyltransferase Ste14
LPADNGRNENIARAMTEVSERMSVLVREEIELAKAEVSQKVSSIVKGAVAVAAGAVFGVFAVILGLFAAAWGINAAFNKLWPGFLIVFGGLSVLTIAAFMFAWRKLRVGAPTPKMAIDEAKKIRATVAAKSEDGAASSAEVTAGTGTSS